MAITLPPKQPATDKQPCPVCGAKYLGCGPDWCRREHGTMSRLCEARWRANAEFEDPPAGDRALGGW